MNNRLAQRLDASPIPNEALLVGVQAVHSAAFWIIQTAILYDAFSPLVLLSLEGYGFCERGGAGDFTEDGGIELGGRLPVNTSGGGMSEAYLHGFNLVVEAVRQVRGTSTNQVDGAEFSLVTAGEGVPTGAVLFRADT